MFTGLIQHIGQISDIKSSTQGKTISVLVDTKEFPEFNNVKTGDSIALNGVCTTVVSLSHNTFTVNLMNESLKRSSLQYLERKNPVNLELAMPADGRFNGHIVQGHVDTVGKIQNITTDGFSKIYLVSCDTKYIVEKGSITLNGVSLTVSKVENNCLEVSLIPHTLQNTTFKFLKEGDFLNVEFDILAKYIEKLTLFKDNNLVNNSLQKIDEKFLLENGF